MFLELDKEPKRIVIQYKNRAGKWYNYAVIQHSKAVDYFAIESILTAYAEQRSEYEEERDVRAVVIGKKSGNIRQVMSYKNLPFYNWLLHNLMPLPNGTFISFVNKKTKCCSLYSSYNNLTSSSSTEHFMFDIQMAGGIKKAKARKETIHDGYLKVWDIELNNGIEYSVAALLPGRD